MLNNIIHTRITDDELTQLDRIAAFLSARTGEKSTRASAIRYAIRCLSDPQRYNMGVTPPLRPFGWPEL